MKHAKDDSALEIESLNVDDLDVVLLEQRIELASAVPLADGWGCTSDCDSLCNPNNLQP